MLGKWQFEANIAIALNHDDDLVINALLSFHNPQKQPPEVFYEKSLKTYQYSQENTCVGVSFLKSLRPSVLQLYQKEIIPQVFSIAKFLKRPIFRNICERLHLNQLVQHDSLKDWLIATLTA